MKICSNCKEEKTLDFFYKDRNSYRHKCKKCYLIHRKQHRESESERLQEVRRIHYQLNKQKIKEKSKKYREDNKEKIRVYDIFYKNKKKEIDPLFKFSL